MELWHILFLLFGHTVADFVFQTDAQAKGKSTDNVVLFSHVTTYMTMFGLFSLVVAAFLSTPPLLWATFLAINFVAHFITDYVTSRITSYYWAREKRHEFFVTIGFDQFAHAAVLLATYNYLLV